MNIDPPVPIPDNNPESPTGIEYTVQIAQTGTITDLDVCINSDHTWPGDLYITLTHGITTVVLMNRPGGGDFGCGDPGLAVYLNDEELISVQDAEACVPFSGVVGEFAPLEALSTFDGQDIGGTWTLFVRDEYIDGTGNLTGFFLWPTLQ